MKRYIKSNMDERFSVKFKGQVYDDAWRDDKDDHIWFGGNRFEHVPTRDYSPAYTYIHDFKPVGGNGFQRVSKKSTAKLQIL